MLQEKDKEEYDSCLRNSKISRFSDSFTLKKRSTKIKETVREQAPISDGTKQPFISIEDYTSFMQSRE